MMMGSLAGGALSRRGRRDCRLSGAVLFSNFPSSSSSNTTTFRLYFCFFLFRGGGGPPSGLLGIGPLLFSITTLLWDFGFCSGLDSIKGRVMEFGLGCVCENSCVFEVCDFEVLFALWIGKVRSRCKIGTLCLENS